MKFKMLSRLVPSLALVLMLSGTVAAQQDGASAYATLTGDDALSALTLRNVIDPLFDPATETPTGETRALIVMHEGQIIAERYAPDFGPGTRLPGWSLAKTVTGLLVGIMVSDGRLALDDRAPVEAWRQTGDPRAAITLRELMQMRSGLETREHWDVGAPSDPIALLAGAGSNDQARHAMSMPLVQPAGEAFAFSSMTSAILAGLVTDQLTDGDRAETRRAAMTQFLRSRFTGPLGIASMVSEFDDHGTLEGSLVVHMTARDYARIGEFLRHRGVEGGRQLLPDSWFDFMLAPSPANPAYGGAIWLNRGSENSQLFPGEAPPEIYGAVGEQGQFILVDPRRRLTVVRLGVTTEAEMPALRSAMARIMRSAG